MADLPAVDLGPAPRGARTFTSRREVRFGDVDRHGHLRLDALAAYLQDVAGDDTADAGLRGVGAWVLRRNVVQVVHPPAVGQLVTLTTWASGAGSRWAERRLSVRAANGTEDVCVDGVSLWVYVDPVTLRPVPLDAGFVDTYHAATGGRTVSSRLQHPSEPETGAPVTRRPWVLRATDIDPLGHVNNAATWAIVEEVLAEDPWPVPNRAELEYRSAIEPGAEVVVDVHRSRSETSLWVRSAGSGPLYATARVLGLPG